MRITGSTQLFGAIGWPISHSLSPAMHNAAAAALGLNLVYLPLPVHPDDLATAVLALPTLGFLGVNVTVPHKQAVMSTLDEIDPAAQAIGAVNTIKVVRGARREEREGWFKLIGYNTDWSGLLADLGERAIDVNGRDCLILGAGGSARAVVYALASAGGRVSLFARRPEQAQQLADSLGGPITAHAWDDLPQVSHYAVAPLIINTTPLGMTPHPETTPWPEKIPFPAGAIVYDLVYNPAETKLMQQAKAAGCQAVNGLGLLLHQGAEAFYLWTGVRPDIGVMAAALQGQPSGI